MKFLKYFDWLTILISLSVLLICASFWGVVKEHRQWNEFSRTHDCKMVSKESNTIVSTAGLGTNGGMVFGTSVVPGKTGWHCNDDVIYYR